MKMKMKIVYTYSLITQPRLCPVGFASSQHLGLEDLSGGHGAYNREHLD